MLTEVSTATDRLVLACEYSVTPDVLFRYWTEPELLTQWWPSAAELDLRAGGSYLLSWPQMGWNLRGSFTAVEPGQRLAFTWNWDHEPDLPERQVDVRFEPVDAGTRLTITHGTYSDSDTDQQDRQSHLAGWQHFSTRLAEVVGGA